MKTQAVKITWIESGESETIAHGLTVAQAKRESARLSKSDCIAVTVETTDQVNLRRPCQYSIRLKSVSRPLRTPRVLDGGWWTKREALKRLTYFKGLGFTEAYIEKR